MTRADLALLVVLFLCVCLIATGAGMIYAPAGLIVGGVLLAALTAVAYLGRAS